MDIYFHVMGYVQKNLTQIIPVGAKFLRLWGEEKFMPHSINCRPRLFFRSNTAKDIEKKENHHLPHPVVNRK